MTGMTVHAFILVIVMAAVTCLLRFLPFLLFRENVPAYISYLGRVLPAAIIGMLVVYCLKDVKITAAPFGLPEFSAGLLVVGLQWKCRNSLLSILGGTLFYMILIQLLM